MAGSLGRVLRILATVIDVAIRSTNTGAGPWGVPRLRIMKAQRHKTGDRRVECVCGYGID